MTSTFNMIARGSIDAKARWRYIIGRRLVSFAIYLTLVQAPLAAPAFYVQCQKLLPTANDFASECKLKARPFSRAFHPSGGSTAEIEHYSVLFKKLDSPSQFSLGCVLDFKGNLNFVGLYYSIKPFDMSRFNDYPIVFIDPNDDVALEINGVQNTFVAIRQFVTDVIPPRLIGRPKNCDDAGKETIGNIRPTAAKNSERFRALDNDEIEYCLAEFCKTLTYRSTGPHTVPIIYNLNDSFMVDANGVLLSNTIDYNYICANWKHNSSDIFDIIYEACAK